MAQERVQKILAQAGIASRRHAEHLIKQGLVTVNGKVASLGDKAEMGKDAIKVEGKLVLLKEPHIYLAFNKPKGVISAMSDPEGRSCIADFLSKVKTRVYPVGRLDFASEGLILLTNDGDFAEKLQKRDDVVRVYHVKVKGHPAPEAIERLSRGAKMGKRIVKPHIVRKSDTLTSKSVIEVVLVGSGAIDVKALFELKGFLVEKITRTSIGQVTLHELEPGHFRYLKPTQVEAILAQPELALKAAEKRAETPVIPTTRRNDSIRGEGFRDKKKYQRDDVEGEGAEGERPSKRLASGVRKKVGGGYAARGARDERPARGGFSRGERDERSRSSFGRGGDERPARGGFGRADRDERPARGGYASKGARDERPARGGMRTGADRPRTSGGYGSYTERPARGGFGRGDRDERPRTSFGRGGDERPRSSFSAKRGPRPERQGDEGIRGGFAAKRGGFGAARGPRRDAESSEFSERPRGPRGPRTGAPGGPKKGFGASRGSRTGGGRGFPKPRG